MTHPYCSLIKHEYVVQYTLILQQHITANDTPKLQLHTLSLSPVVLNAFSGRV